MHANMVPEQITIMVRQYIVDNFLFGDGGGLGNDQSLLDAGALDSTGVIELVSFLEETFTIGIGDQDLVPDNFDSVDRIARFVTGKLRERTAQGQG